MKISINKVVQIFIASLILWEAKLSFAFSGTEISKWEFIEGDIDVRADLKGQLKQKKWKRISGVLQPDVGTNKNIWMRTKLNNVSDDSILYVEAIDQDYEIYLKGKLWKKYGIMDDNGVGGFFDWRPHFISLSSEFSGEYIYFRIYSDHSNIGFTGTPVLAPKHVIYSAIFKSELPKYFIVMCLIIMGLVTLFVVLGGGDKYIFLSASFISVFGGIYLFTKTSAPYVLYESVDWFSLEVVSLTLVPCFYALFLSGLSTGYSKVVFVSLFFINGFMFILSLAYAGSDYLDLRKLIVPIQVFLVLTMLSSVKGVLQGAIDGKKSFKMLFFATVLAGIGIVVEVVISVGLIKSNISFAYYSGFILFFCMSVAAGMEFKEQFKISRQLEEEKSLQREKNLKDKMQAITTLASGMAHEITEPLSVIKNSCASISRLVSMDSSSTAGKELIEQIDASLARVNNIIQSLAVVSKNDVDDRIEVPLSVVMAAALDNSFSYAKQKNVTFTHVKIPNDIYITCLLDNMEEALLGIILNAVEAASKTIEKWVAVDIVRGKNEVLIKVKDSGLGIPKSKLNKIFEPFYSTKYDGQGAGLGLSIAHKIIAGSGGKLWVDETEANTTFIVQLPCINVGEVEFETNDERILRGISKSSIE